MTSVTIYCSIRFDEDSNADVKFFSERECAKIDQQLQAHFKNFGKTFITPIKLVVDGTAYVAEVVTKKEYKLELEKRLLIDKDNEDLIKALRKVKSL